MVLAGQNQFLLIQETLKDNGDIAYTSTYSFNMTKEELEGLQLFINPNECIDCGACVPECPEDAIYKDEDEAIALGDKESIDKNYGFYGLKYKKSVI